EPLYQEAAAAYVTQSSEWFTAELGAATDTRSAFYRLLTTAAREFTRKDLPPGCMVSLACTNVPPALDSLRELMTRYRCKAQAAMAERIQRGIDEGDVPDSTNARALAAFYSALSRGMAVLARDGATQDDLLQVVEIGMRAWPPAAQRPAPGHPKQSRSM